MKNRITKTLRAKAGFTLVELIVVIAILGILAGVGTVGYSGYIKKANMAADQTLISSIENALMLAGYGNTFAAGESGYITLSTDGIVNKDQITEGSGLDEAMKAAFGADYKDSMKLSYNGWGSSGLIDSLTPAMAMSVSMSSYMTGNRVDDLLSDVEKMTKMAGNLVTVLKSSEGVAEGTTLSTLFTADVLNETAAKYGIGEKDWTAADWDAWGAEDENKTAYSNLLVLAAADEAEKHMNALQGGEAYNMSPASKMVTEFSSYYAFAAQNKDFSKELDDLLDELNDSTKVYDVNSGAAWYRKLTQAATNAGYEEYKELTDPSGIMKQSDIDTNGFLSIMAGLGNPTEEQAALISADLNNASLFTTGVVNGMYNDYLDAVDAVSVLPDDDDAVTETIFSAGQVAILFVQKDGETVITSSLPEV